MTASLYEVINLLEVASQADSRENEIWTAAGNILNLVEWAGIHASETTCWTWPALLDWLHEEARKYEASLDEEEPAAESEPSRHVIT